MQQAIELARNGLGWVSPNPPVGCVIVAGESSVVGRGWHQMYGEAHAEVNALEEAGARAQGATAYVTLMPCNHQGKTPPCTQALIRAGVKRVVVSVDDPDPVSGEGLKTLEDAGIEVSIGLLEDETKKMMHGFIKFIQTKLPHITLKYAMTLDGCIATASGDSKWISSEESRESVQAMRADVDAVMVGSSTLVCDDPRLNVRDHTKAQPFRVIIDSKLRTPVGATVFKTSGGKVVILGSVKSDQQRVVELKRSGAEVILVPDCGGHIDLRVGLEMLAEQFGIRSIICEGGGGLAGALLRSKLVDKVVAFIAPKILGGSGISPTTGEASAFMNEAQSLDSFEVSMIGGDAVCSGWIRHDQ